VCDQETSRMRKLNPATGLWKIQPRGCYAKKTNKQYLLVHVFNFLLYNFRNLCNYVSIIFTISCPCYVLLYVRVMYCCMSVTCNI